jgi:hypothetical protein
VAALVLAGTSFAAPAVTQRYQDPEKIFSIDYPRSWKVSKLPNGLTAFYVDHPSEGTSFTILPNMELAGARDAVEIWRELVDEQRRRVRDYTITSQKQHAGDMGQKSVETTYVQSNLKGVQMRGWMLFTVQVAPTRDRTFVGLVSYQAPVKEFAAVEPVFRRMLSSLTFNQKR